MQEYFFLFSLTLLLSTIFAVAGLGSAVALVPSVHLSGLTIDISRALGNYLLHHKVSSSMVKKILAVALYIVAVKMLWLS